jgi:hypothetical protein
MEPKLFIQGTVLSVQESDTNHRRCDTCNGDRLHGQPWGQRQRLSRHMDGTGHDRTAFYDNVVCRRDFDFNAAP